MSAPRPDGARPPDRLEHGFDHRWHVAINRFHAPNGIEGPRRTVHESWMYEAKEMADEVPRLALLFGMEREGRLARHHHQCSRDHEGQPVGGNHLTCCLGVHCRECPFLVALDAAQMSDQERDLAKAWTCATHIVSNGGDPAKEGYILTVDDRMFWDNVYTSLAAEEPDDLA